MTDTINQAVGNTWTPVLTGTENVDEFRTVWFSAHNATETAEYVVVTGDNPPSETLVGHPCYKGAANIIELGGHTLANGTPITDCLYVRKRTNAPMTAVITLYDRRFSGIERVVEAE